VHGKIIQKLNFSPKGGSQSEPGERLSTIGGLPLACGGKNQKNWLTASCKQLSTFFDFTFLPLYLLTSIFDLRFLATCFLLLDILLT